MNNSDTLLDSQIVTKEARPANWCDDLELDKARLAKKSRIANDDVAASCSDANQMLSEQNEGAESDSKPQAMVRLRSIKGRILQTARHFPFILDDQCKSLCCTVLKGNLTLQDVVSRVRLGHAQYQESLGKNLSVRCLLQWVEPFTWRYCSAVGPFGLNQG